MKDYYKDFQKREEKYARKIQRRKTIVCVRHPMFGELLVHGSSNYDAVCEAARIMRCDWVKLRGAEVVEADPELAAAMRREEARNE